jgi:amino acid transporter
LVIFLVPKLCLGTHVREALPRPPALARIFSVLAVLAVLLLAANFAVGLWVGDFNAAAQEKLAAQDRLMKLAHEKTSPEYEQARRDMAAADARFQVPRGRMTLHMLLGAGGALVAILVNSITITYFVGTSRWCKEVCETYRLPAELAERSTRLKRSTFPWAVMGVLAVILVVGLGAAADPSGANFTRSVHYVTPHYIAATVMLLVVAGSFWVQINRIADNYAVIEEILTEVKRVRSGTE